jgi:hypothetical protein
MSQCIRCWTAVLAAVVVSLPALAETKKEAAAAPLDYAGISELADKPLLRQGYQAVKYNDAPAGDPRITFFPISGRESEACQPIKRWVRFVKVSGTRTVDLGGDWQKSYCAEEVVEVVFYYVKVQAAVEETVVKKTTDYRPVKLYTSQVTKTVNEQAPKAVEAR